MQRAELWTQLEAWGARPVHRDSVLRAWLQGLPLVQARSRRQTAEQCFPKQLWAQLPELTAQLDQLVRVCSEHPDGLETRRLLMSLADGMTVETVLLPRGGVCVSSQVGCAVGCTFCMTGRSGLLRQLTSLEIVAQVVHARRRQPVRKVVFMGMGEPAHNLEAVIEAIELLGTWGGIGHKQLVFSTVGDPRAFARLPTLSVKPALALSLHTLDPEKRRHLLPKAPPMSPHEVLSAGLDYARATGYPLQLQWTLLDGVNDGPDELAQIPDLLRGQPVILNVIPYNRHEGDTFARPGSHRIQAWVDTLSAQGVLIKVRDSAGQSVDGGCGQLRARRIAVA